MEGPVSKKGVMATHMEEEMVIDILWQLPVMSLLRFKCVSQSWNTFISRPDFKKKHLLHSKKYPKVIIQKKRSLLELARDESLFCSWSLSSCQTVKDLLKLNSESIRGYTIRACYDGLVLLGAPHRPLILWNPSSRELIQLPQENLFCPDKFKLYGLGYDENCHDYKVFKAGDDRYVGDDEILALKSGSWRLTDDGGRCGYFSEQMDCLALVDGAFHWTRYGDSILSFHISNEVYGEVPFPEEIEAPTNGTSQSYQGVTELRGMLSIHSYVHEDDKSRSFHLWVMKDYGVKESWTKLFTIDDNTWITVFQHIIPKYMFEDDEVLVRCKGRIFRISKGPDGPIVRVVIDENTFMKGYVFTESLISPLVQMRV